MCKLGFFFFNDTATTEIYTLSLHDALPISTGEVRARGVTSAPNAVLPPWLKQELTAILARLPAVTTPEEERPARARWATTPRRRPTWPRRWRWKTGRASGGERG